MCLRRKSLIKEDIVGPFYGTIVYHDLSLRQPARSVYENGALKMEAGRFSRYALQLRVQGTQSDRITEQLGNRKAVCCVPAHFCVCAYTADHCCAKEDIEYELHQKKLSPNARSLNMTFQQEAIFSDDQLADPYRIFKHSSRGIHRFENLYAVHGRKDFAASADFCRLQ